MMFDKNYKSAMDGIRPSDAAVTATLDAMNNAQAVIPRARSILRVALISCFVVILVCMTLIAAFNNSSDVDGSMPPLEEIISGAGCASGSESTIISDLFIESENTTSADISEMSEPNKTDISSKNEFSEIITENSSNTEISEEIPEESSNAEESTEPEVPDVSEKPDVSETEPDLPDEPIFVPVDSLTNTNILPSHANSLYVFSSYADFYENLYFWKEYNNEAEESTPELPTVDEPANAPDSNANEVVNDDSINVEPIPDSGEISTDKTPNYSGTNNQVLNVDEADIVKTDGRYIYYCQYSGDCLFIAEAVDGNLKQTRYIDLSTDDLKDVEDILLVGDKLAVITSIFDTSKKVKYHIYDVSDKSNPIKLNTLVQDGTYSDARMIGNNIYLISNTYESISTKECIDMNGESIPCVNNKKIPANCIYAPIKSNNLNGFTIVTAYDITSDSANFKSQVAVMGLCSDVYVSENNIYITEISSTPIPEKYKEGDIITDYSTIIYRISIDDGSLKSTGAVNIPGQVSRQFWMDEQDGKFRVATNIGYSVITSITDEPLNYMPPYTSKALPDINKVYVLDEGLNVIGMSADLGVDENIKSVRYIGDIAYVVTFKQTDPLYAIDLSDPTDLKVMSALNIDGYSSYMHPYGDELLLGIGFEADPSTGIEQGLRITMFDISDTSNIKAVSTYSYSWDLAIEATSPATSEHKAVLIDSDKDIISMPITFTIYEKITDNTSQYKDYLYYVFFEYTGGVLKEKAAVKICERVADDEDCDIRGLYIDDYCYVLTRRGITSISISTYEIINEMDFLRFNPEDYVG